MGPVDVGVGVLSLGVTFDLSHTPLLASQRPSCPAQSVNKVEYNGGHSLSG